MSARDERLSGKRWSAEDTRRGLAFGMSLAGDDRPPDRLGPNGEARGTVVIEVETNTRTVRIGYGAKPLGDDDLYWNVRV